MEEDWIAGQEQKEYGKTYAGNDSIVACKMRFAVFAAEDLVGVEVGVVDKAHARRLVACGLKV